MNYDKKMKFFIAAPFGNYIKYHSFNNIIPVTGTWTLKYRGAWIKRIFKMSKTLRYSIKHRGWTNKLGLPNPGIEVGLAKTNNNEVLSIAELEKGDFEKLSYLIPIDQSVEINLSCPNIKGGEKLPWDDVKYFNRERSIKREYCIAKISPLTTTDELKFLIDEIGFNQIHCCNTLPVKKGGLSGKELKPYVDKLISIIRTNWGTEIEIIAGGGVVSKKNAIDYIEKGADHISLGTVCFTPWKIKNITV